MDWQKKSYSLTAGSHTLKWVYSKDSSGSAGEDCGWVDGLKVGTTSFVGQPDAMSEALDSQLKFTESGTGDWWLATGEDDDYYYEADSAQATGTQGEEACLQAIVDSPNSETVENEGTPYNGTKLSIFSRFQGWLRAPFDWKSL